MPLLLLHPNGFCAGLFDPLARQLRGRFHPVGVDLRAHGGTDAPTEVADYAFDLLAGDVLAVLDHLGLDHVVALGQSLGGGVATLVDRLRPGLIGKLLLCEAIAFSHVDHPMRERGQGPGNGGNFMADIARKRREVWPDRETVLRSYGSRPPLDELAPEALEAYVRWGFVDRPDGRVELACPPAAEATIFEVSSYEQGALQAWNHLGSLTASATVVCGDRSDLPPAWFAAQAERAGARLVTVAGGHFFLQEDTARAERFVLDYLG